MSRKLRVTEEESVKYVTGLLEYLKKLKITQEKFSYAGALEAQDRRARLVFTPMAWSKMLMLVYSFDKEVAWHGVCDRGEAEDEYIVSDILVYPQSTNGAYVDMDEEKYSQWIAENLDAPWQGRLHLQGHSHVDMGVSPSGEDMKHQEEVLASMRPEGFKVFVIWNKRMQADIRIYDNRTNMFFGSQDVDLEVRDSEYDVAAFLREAKEMVKSYTYSAAPSWKGGTNYGTGYGAGYGANKTPGVYSAAAQKPAAPAPAQSSAASRPKALPPADWDDDDDDDWNTCYSRGYYR